MGKMGQSSDLSKYQTTYNQTLRMINLMDRKRKIINLKVAVEDGLANMNEEGRRILTLFYIDGIKASLISQLLGISIRTFFRQKLKALEEFCEKLQSFGYGEKFFEKDYLEERWLVSLYNEMIQKSAEEEDLVNAFFIRKVVSMIGKSATKCNTYI